MNPRFGLHYMLWRNPNYGDIRLMINTRTCRARRGCMRPASRTCPYEHVYINLRYDIP